MATSHPPTIDARGATRAAPVAGRRGPTPGMQTLLALALYLVYTAVLTWPVVIHPGSATYGVGGDLTGGIAQLREVVQHHVFPFAPSRIAELDAPFGQVQPWATNLASAPSLLLQLLFAYPLGAVAATNVFLFAGYVLSGTSMFLLARKLSGSAGAALVAGFGFAFYPFAVLAGQGHIHFAHGWVFVLMLWRLLALAERPTARNGLLAGFATVLAMAFTAYFILFGGVLFASVAVVVLLLAARARRFVTTLRALVVAGVVVLVFGAVLGVLALAGAGGGGGGLRVNDVVQLITYSARPREWVLPVAQNPIVGSVTGPYLGARIHGSNASESSLYLGWVLLAFAAGGLVVALATLRRDGRPALRAPATVAAILAAAIGVVAAAFSLPPQITVAGALVPTPMHYVFDLTSTWRVSSRFVILIELGVSVLAALGLAALLRRTGRRAPIVAAVVLALVAVDLWARPPGAVSRITLPPLYERIAKLPPGIVAEYPLQAGDVPDYTAIDTQDVAHHPVFQGYARGSESESRKLELSHLSDAGTIRDLAALGVRYVVRRPILGDERPGSGLKRLFGDASGTVYEVTAPPSRAQADGLEGFGDPEGTARDMTRWLLGPKGELYVRAACPRTCAATLSFRTFSYGRPRTLTITAPGGRILVRRRIPVSSVTVRVPLRLQGAQVLGIEVSPGAIAVPNGDPRPLTIAVIASRLDLD